MQISNISPPRRFKGMGGTLVSCVLNIPRPLHHMTGRILVSSGLFLSLQSLDFPSQRSTVSRPIRILLGPPVRKQTSFFMEMTLKLNASTLYNPFFNFATRSKEFTRQIRKKFPLAWQVRGISRISESLNLNARFHHIFCQLPSEENIRLRIWCGHISS